MVTAFGWVAAGIAIAAGLRAVWWLAWEQVRTAAMEWYALRQEILKHETVDSDVPGKWQAAMAADTARWRARPWYVKFYEWGDW